MMLPNQINTQRFSTVGKGGYKAAEVDVFMQKLFQHYNRLYNDNNILKERLASLTPLIDEYNENKKAIANALIWAQTTSDKTVNEAKSDAQKIVDAANAEAESLIADKKAEADAVYADELKEAQLNLDSVKKELDRFNSEKESLSSEYIAGINAKAENIISDANAKASKIVSDAYNDARTAREKADTIMNEAKRELASVKKEIAMLKADIEKAVTAATKAISAVEIGDIENEIFAREAVEALQIDKEEIEKFEMNFTGQVDEDTAEADFSVKDDFAEEPTKEPVFTVDDVSVEEDVIADGDFISGPANNSMPDVNEYITKIFESAGSADSDFSSFTEGLDDLLTDSLKDKNISFEELKKSVDENGVAFEE